MNDDYTYMMIAIRLARRNLGNTAPNPAVGCVIVKDDHIVSRGCTQKDGRPHAEKDAIDMAKARGVDLQGACMYVSLEPCCHYGITSPCTGEIISSGIRRVVIATEDPNPLICGNGIRILKEHGLDVTCGVCENEAIEINKGFFSIICRKRPYVTVKIAVTIDGKIASCNGSSKWISNPTSRKIAHMIRAINDGVLIGSGTAIKDCPSLDVRINGIENLSPIRIFLSGNASILNNNFTPLPPKEKNMFIFTQSTSKKSDLAMCYSLDGKKGKCSIKDLLHLLASKNITRLLVEGGSKVIESFLKEDMIDELIVHRNASIAGGDAMDFTSCMQFFDSNEFKKFKLSKLFKINGDIHEYYRNK